MRRWRAQRRGGARRPAQGAGQHGLAGQARRLSGTRSLEERDLHRRGRVRRRIRQAGPRSRLPGGAADQGQDSERREGPLRQDAEPRRNPHDYRGARLRHWHRRVRCVQAAVPPRDHHDGRRRGRIAHPHAAAHVLLPADARPGGSRAHLHRAAAAVPREARPAETFIRTSARWVFLLRRAAESRTLVASNGKETSGEILERRLERP